MTPALRLAAPCLALMIAAAGVPAAGAESGSAATVPPGPHLARIALSATVPIERVLAAGLDVIELRRGIEARVLLWPGDDERVATLGLRAELLDPDPGATLARRSATDRLAHPLPARPARVVGGNVLPPFGSGSMGGYWTLSEVKLKLDDLVASDAQDLVADQLDTLGYSVQGRPIWGLRIGRTVAPPDLRPVVFMNALTHAREPEGMQTLFHFVDDLIAKYGVDPLATSLLDQRVLYIVPVVNPDGYQINVNTYVTSGGTSFGMWRKNARDNNTNGVVDSQDGVDINRNYGFQWNYDNIGSSGLISAETYRGPAKFSEPETRAQRDIFVALRPRTGLSFHTFSDLMLFPWGYTTTRALDDDAFKEWTDAASYNDGYQTGQSTNVLYSVNGEFNDWTYGDTLLKPRAFTWTPEIGNPDDDFYPPPSRILPLAEENLRRCYVVTALAGAYVRIERAAFAEGPLDIGALEHLSVRARNLGLADAGPLLQATLVSKDPGVEVLSGPVSYPTISSRQSADALGGATFEVGTADTLTPGRPLRFEVDFSTPDGFFSRDSLEIPAGTPTVVYHDEAASLAPWTSLGGWGIAPGTADHPGPWFADSPGGNYAANTNRSLTLNAPLDLSAGVHAYAYFGSRWDIETGYDAAMLEASLDGVTWSELAGHSTSLGIPGQPAGQPIYQGTRHRWAAERVDLSPFSGPSATSVRFRARLTSDSGNEFDGFNFDSLVIVTFDPAAQPAPVAVPGGARAARFAITGPIPNPARSSATFTLELPAAGKVGLEILDLAGRRVRTLAGGPLPSGRFVRGWDLCDEAGRRAAPGLYFARLVSGTLVTARRFAVVR